MNTEVFDPAGLDESVTVVTATGRLARAVREAHAVARRSAGDLSWRTPDVLPWAPWVARCFRELRAHGHVSGALLPAASREVLWAQVVVDDAGARVLSPRAIAAAAANAEELLCDHVLDVEAAHLGATAETQAFARWRMELDRRCRVLGYVNPVSAAGALIEHAGGLAELIAERLFVLGFDDLPARHVRVLEALTASGVSITRVAWRSAQPAPRVAKAEFANAEAELTAAARWCAGLIENGEPGPIGVVIPDLDQRLGAVKDCFEGVVAGVAPSPNNLIHVSLGPALSRREMVADALAMLRISGAGMSVQDAGRLLLSPHTKGAREESVARATLHAAILESGLSVIPAAQMQVLIAKTTEQPGLSLDSWADILERVEALECPLGAGPSFWAMHVSDILRAFGWPGDRAPDSVGHQVLQAWNDLLDRFAALDDVLDEAIGFSRALEILDTFAAGTIFAPKAQPAPVQIMGVLESSGLSFTHLWVCGLDDSRWPPPANPTAFLPYDLQRDARMPNASPALALERAGRMTQGWLQAASEETVLSYAAMQGDAERGPSPLLDGIAPCSSEVATDGSPSLAFDRLRADAPAMETFTDWVAPPLVAGSSARGGSNALKDYAACPFRAFARHRLGASAIEQRGAPPDPIMRGQILHEAARVAWRRLRTYESLIDSTDSALEKVALDAVDVALRPFVERYANVLDTRTIDIERNRAGALLLEWLGGERRRPPFKVLGHERKVTAQLAGLSFSLRIDRIDELQDDKVLLIDYKTGKSSTPTSWMGDRPDEPQLPVYALAWEQRGVDTDKPVDVGAIAFAQIHRAETAFKGLGDSSGQPIGVVPLEKSRSRIIKAEADTWSDWRARSERQLVALASGYATGNAAVDPKHTGVCDRCDLHALCRVAELGGADAYDERAVPGDGE